jgi:ribosomal protein S18 acetylase RimI-like enzyme
MTQQARNAIETRAAVRDDFPDIARLIAHQNETPALQCIHSGEGYESILKTMLKWADASEFCFAIAFQDGRLAGAFGCEFDKRLGRAWLWGPFVLTANWDELAGTLMDRLLAILPPAIRRLDFFLNNANQRAYNFYLGRGFRDPKVSHVYVAPRPPVPLPVLEPCSPLEPALAASLATLHDVIFPNTYYTGQDILDQQDGDHKVFVSTTDGICAAGGEVLGYIYAIIDESGEGYVEFLGVRSDLRGQGLGKRLLLTALDWLFCVKNVPEVGLTVSDDQANARSLYEQVGFRIKYTGLSARKYL